MLTSDIDRYLELRRALGYKLQTAECFLRSFARMAEERGDTHVVSQTALDWAALTKTIRQRDKRLTTIVGLARFLHAEDPRHEIPLRDTAHRTYPRPAPYIFSPQEILRLGQAAARLRPAGSLRASAFSTLFNLLAVTGLRISEALNLNIKDFTPDGLVIGETKFRKSRLVPIHETTAKALTIYLERRQRVPTDHDRFFVSSRRTPICYETALRVFRRLCAETEIGGTPPVLRPRLHDLRHTVAVRMLQGCPNVRDETNLHVLALSTYLGHGSLQGTYWYLHSSPELMRDIANVSHAWITGDTI